MALGENRRVKYLLLIHNNPEALDGLSPQERAKLIGADRLTSRVRSLQESGELVTVLALAEPSESKTVQVVAGTPVISDRPFLETKEFLAGGLLLECPTIDRALEIAAELPFAEVQRIEVRPLRSIEDLGIEDPSA